MDTPKTIRKSALKSFLKGKFKKLGDEGYQGKQKVAIALSYAKKAKLMPE